MLLLQPLNISEPLPNKENDAIAASIDPNPPCSNSSDVLPSVILSIVCSKSYTLDPLIFAFFASSKS